MWPTSRYAGWLPPIPTARRGGGWGWFPMKATSVAAIFAAVTSTEPTAAHHVALVRALVSDPALVIATAALVSSSETLTADEQVSAACSPTSMAQWWCRFGTSRWKQIDWLAAPIGMDAASRARRFERLDDSLRSVPRRRWLDQSQPFFDVAGVESPITQPIRQAWFNQDSTADPVEVTLDAHQIIARVVAENDGSIAREESLASTITSIKRGLAHRLAYGLSHEINNPLANISTRAQTLASVTEDLATRESLNRIVDQTRRAHAMIADLMFYAHPPEPVARPFDLHERLRQVIRAVTPDAARLGIEIAAVLHEEQETFSVQADAEMIGEAIAVLLRNSIEAIGTDGMIQVRCGVEQCGTDELIQISVCDSGPGLSPEQAAMAKDPFYSGREAGRGLGLGLCRAERIADLHGGSLTLSAALVGCVATLTLPRTISD